MINWLSNYMLNYLISSSVIDDSEEEKIIYKYGTEIAVSSILNVVLVVAIGLFTSSFVESIIFTILLIVLRLFTGGYHAETYFKCNLILCLNYISAITLYKLTLNIINTNYTIIISLVALILISILSPIENKNKVLSSKKKKINKMMSIILGALYGTAAIVLSLFEYKIGILILYTLASVSIAVVAGKIHERS